MTPGLRPGVLFLAGLAFSLGCRPTLDDRPWLVTKLQVVGWKANPPEAPPGSEVTLEIVALGPAGAPDTTATSWTLCRAPRPLDESRVVSADCLAPSAPDAVGDPVRIAIPTDACRIFGPDVAQPAPGAPPTRPRDPDATGGYYQPLTISLGTSLAVGLERVTCDLPDASLAISRAFQLAYQPNQNPAISALRFTMNGAPVDPAAVPPGARITIEATWFAGAVETFPVFDRSSGAIVDTRETLVGSWYVTGGDLDQPAAQISDPTVLAILTHWIAPSTPGTVDMAFVLRDSRGGSDVAQATLAVAAPSP